LINPDRNSPPHIRESQSLFYPKSNTKTKVSSRIQRRARLPLEATAAPVVLKRFIGASPGTVKDFFLGL
ncbi:hypothetical protein, partial [Rhizobium sp. FKL33]|uniref:hypothetical protein n=1 Tax=Rhizobium sp. FKL33 TaxID=2562307 RepID=UPI00197E9CA2